MEIRIRKGARKTGGEKGPKKEQEKARHTELRLCVTKRTRNRGTWLA